MPSSPKLAPEVPNETAQAVRSVYNIQHVYLRIGDQIEGLFGGFDLTTLDPSSGLEPQMVFRFPMVTAFQYAETLADAPAAEAILQRMDWKYALRLPARHPGIPAASLCLFRQDLYGSRRGIELFDGLLARLGELGLFSRAASRELNATEVLLSVCQMNRLYELKLAMKSALSLLVSTAPDWLRLHALPHWYERYQTGRLGPAVSTDPQQALAEALALGEDLSSLLEALGQPGAPQVEDTHEILSVRRLIGEQYCQYEGGLNWRLPGCANCASHLMKGSLQ